MARNPDSRFTTRGPYGPDNPPPPPPGSPPREEAYDSRRRQFYAPYTEPVQAPAPLEPSDYSRYDAQRSTVAHHEVDQYHSQQPRPYRREERRGRSRSPKARWPMRQERSAYREDAYYRERSSYSRSADKEVQQYSSTPATRHRHETWPTYTDQTYKVEDEVDWGDNDFGYDGSLSSTKLRRHPEMSRDGDRIDRPIRNGHDHGVGAIGEIDHYSPPPKPKLQGDSRPVSRTDYVAHSAAFDSHGVAIPSTAYDLRNHDFQVVEHNKKHARERRFFNGNGKVKPALYGSSSASDLGLCFTTFCTKYRCEMGLDCPWRHHPLTKEEKKWILSVGGEPGQKFIKNAAKWWNRPDIPLPGARMHDKAHQTKSAGSFDRTQFG